MSEKIVPNHDPARVDSAWAAKVLGFHEHDIPILMRDGFLKPLGHPPPNGVKYFATVTLLELANDVHWLGRASDAIVRHWQKKNSKNGKQPRFEIHAGTESD